jgi:amino-acid N-acetyltransferase
MELIAELLTACGLPVLDLDHMEARDFLACGPRSRPAGVVGLQVAAPYGLLRSLAVRDDARGDGCGTALVHAAEQMAGARGLLELYLLTETAETFFRRLGFRKVEREHVPEAIRRTQEFSSICPDSAVIMAKAMRANAAHA